jgi:hypothetical protein
MPDTLPNIQNFYDAVKAYGIGRKYNFVLEAIDGAPPDVDTLLKNSPYTLYAQSAKIPSRKITTAKVPYKAFEFNVPTTVSYPDNESWELTFISDNYLNIRNIFETWSRYLYNNETNSMDPTAINFGKCNLTFNLLSEPIATNPAGTVPDPAGNIYSPKSYTLYGVYPTVINGAQYDVSSSGQEVAKVTVTLAFQFFTTV